MSKINNIENNLEIELKKFWIWAGKTPEEYSRDRGYGEWEVDYPEWQRLDTCFYAAINAIKEGDRSEKIARLMLDAIAIDNERESLLYECETELNDNELEFIFESLVEHIQSEARWQIAWLIGKKQKKEWEKFLDNFINDKDKYVQRRALLALSNINPDKAVIIALKKTKDTDEYMRLAALHILYESQSNRLADVMEYLKDDSSPVIQHKIKEIKQQ